MSDSVFDVINRRFLSGNDVCVERTHIKSDEWSAIQTQLTAARDEAEKLRGRVSELERYKNSWSCLGFGEPFEVMLHSLVDGGFRLYGPGDAVKHFKSQFSPGDAAILRKQAEAVESARDEICNSAASPSWHSIELTDYAQRLRAQADELEKGNDPN